MKDSLVKPRQLAVDICFQVVVKGVSLSEALASGLDKLENDRDKGFCSELCYGFCRFYFVLDASLKKLLQKSLKARDKDVTIILLLGLYQIRFMRVSDHAAVNESVKLLRKIGKNWAKGLVNAVLRSYIRELERSGKKSAQVDEENAPSLPLEDYEQSIAYPEWIKGKVNKDWEDKSGQIFKAGNSQAPMVLRVDLKQITRAEMIQKLLLSTIEAKPHDVIAQAIVLQKAQSVELLPGFAEGLISVQDAAAQIAADLLNCKPGMRVLDACAAPGGKTLHILQSSSGLSVLALDKDDVRLNRIHENLSRANQSAEVVCADASDVGNWFDGAQFDRILLDAPCSASGIIRRHPDIRLLRKASDIVGLVQQQQKLLDTLWPLLKPDGLMVYSTCSIFKDENEHQIERFISAQDNCVEQPLNTVQWGEKRPYGRQILSGTDEMDGFYYACLIKTS